MIKKILAWTIRPVLGGILGIGTGRMNSGAHITRYRMYERLRSAIDDPSHGSGKTILSISHSERLIECLGLQNANVVEANYPDYSATDLSAFSSERFDFVLSDQVLEHVEGSPQAVFDETWRVLKPGGIAVHTTCFMNPLHGCPSDFWRFTVPGLKHLARKFSEVVQAEGFGNRAVWLVSMLGHRYTPIPHATWHPLNKIANRIDPDWLITTWIVVRK